MNKKNFLIMAGVLTATVGASIPYIQSASAQGELNLKNNSDLITKIATKFNLNQNEVQAVFDEERALRVAEREKDIEERLRQEVSAGKITEAQKKLILEHHANNQAKMEEIKNITDEAERKLAFEKLREENQKWAKENSINQKYLSPERHLNRGSAGKHQRGTIN